MSESTNFFMAIAGNIGSGKSSLTTILAQQLNWQAFYEIVETNPYLSDFYVDMRRWSFQTQIFFLTKRFLNLKQILASKDPVIQDRSIYEDAEVFAKSLYLHGAMDERDYKTYLEHFQVMTDYLRTPDLIVYLRCRSDKLLERIESRGRPYEQCIPKDYILRLNDQYEAWSQSYQRGPMAIVDVTHKDFMNKPEDLRHIIAIIRWEIERVQNRQQAALPLGIQERANEPFVQKPMVFERPQA